MGLFGWGSDSNEEIIEDNWQKRNPAAYDVEAIVSTLDDGDQDIRVAASELLIEVAENAPKNLEPHLKELAPSLNDPNTEVVVNITHAVACVAQSDPWPVERFLIDDVVANLSADDREVGRHALWVVAQVARSGNMSAQSIAASSPSALSDVASFLTDPEPVCRGRAAATLRDASAFHPDWGTDYVSDLIPLLEDPDDNVVETVAAALSYIATEHPEAVMPALDRLVTVASQNELEIARLSAFSALSYLSLESPDTVGEHADTLAAALNDSSAEIRTQAVVVCANISESAPETVAPYRDRVDAIAQNHPEEIAREHARTVLEATDDAG